MIPSILITDDDLGFRDTLCGVFEPQGFRTLVADDGEEALSIIERETVHLLVLDMHMPRLSGLETIRRIKQRGSRMPCILLSADLDDTIRQQARLAQAFSVLSKPISGRQITWVVRSALQQAYDLSIAFEFGPGRGWWPDAGR